MPYNAGTAYLQVVPSFRNVQRELENLGNEIGRHVDRAVANALPNGVNNGARDTQRAMDNVGDDSGRRFGSAFERRWRQHLTSGQRALGEIDVEGNTRPIDHALDNVRERMRELSERPITPDFDERDAIRGVRQIRSELRRLESDPSATRRDLFNIRAAHGEMDALSNVLRDARRRGDVAGGRYAEGASRAIRAGLRDLPEIHLGLNPTEFETRLHNVRRELTTLSSTRVGIDLDDATFHRRIEVARAELDELGRMAPTVRLQADLAAARGRLQEFLERQVPEMANNSGNRSADEFGGSFQRRIRAVLSNLPDIDPTVNLSRAQARLQELRRQIAALDDGSVDLSVDTGRATEQIRQLRGQLLLLASSSPDIRVRTDALRAAAELRAVLVEARQVDGLNVNVDVNTDADRAGTALRQLGNDADVPIHRLGVLVALGFSIGPAIVPAAAGAAVAIGGLATAATAAVAAFGVLALGMFGIFGTVQAMQKAQEEQAKTAKSLSQSETAVANALDGVKNAERGLANTRESVASARRRAAQAVTDAEKGVTSAVEDRRQAEEALTTAIKEAQKADEDRRLSIRGVALDLRQANLDVVDAKKALDAVLVNPRATEAEREQARITFEQKILQIDELKTRQQRLADDQAKADKDGVAGSDQVRAAQQRVKDSTDRIADAQQRLAEAILAEQDQQRQGAFQLAQATQSVAQAQRALQQAYTNSSTAGGAAFQNLQTELAKLSPAGQAFSKFLFGLKGQFQQLRFAAQEGMFPGFTRALQELLRYLPGVTDFVGRLARGIGDGFEWAVKQMQNPQWQRFFRHISDSAVPALQGMLQFTEAISRGLGSLIVALSPFNRSMGEGLISWAEGFATWADRLTSSAGYKKFLAYVAKAGPDVIKLLGSMWEFTKRFVIAAAPVGDKVVKIFTALFNTLNSIDIKNLTRLITAIAAFSALMLINKARMVLWAQTMATTRGTIRLLTTPFKAMRTLFVGTNGQLSGLTRAHMAWNTQLTRGAILISPVVTRLIALEAAVRRASVAVATRAWSGFTTAMGRVGTAARSAQTWIRGLGADLRAAFITPAIQATRTRLVQVGTAVRGAQTWVRGLGTDLRAAFITPAIQATQARLVQVGTAVRGAQTWVRGLGTDLRAAFVTPAIQATQARLVQVGTAVRALPGWIRGVGTDLRAAFITPTIQATQTQLARFGTTMRALPGWIRGVGTDLRAAFIAPAIQAAQTQATRFGSAIRGAQTWVRGVGTDLRAAFVTPAIQAAQTQVTRFGSAVRALPMAAATAAQRLFSTAVGRVNTTAGLAGGALGRLMTAARSGAVTVATGAQNLFAGAISRVSAVATPALGALRRLTGGIDLSAAASTVAGRATAFYSGTLGAFSTAANRAATAAGALARGVGTGMAAAVGGTARAFSGLAGFLGGPWGIALTAATIGITAWVASSQKAKQRARELRDGLLQLVDVYKDGFTPSANDNAKSLLAQDANLRRLVSTLQTAGFNTRQIVAAVGGEATARQAIVAALDEQIRNELLAASAARNGSDADTVASAKHKDRAQALKEMRKALIDAGLSGEQAAQVAQALAVTDEATAEDQRQLNETFRDGARAADILRNAYKQLYGDAQDREQALENERAAFDRLKESVKEHGATLDANTEAGRANRQAMRDRIQTLADLAAADIASTGQISKDTQDRIDKLKAEFLAMGFNEQQVDKMIKMYLGVPPKILTEIILNGGANAQGVLNETGKKALELIATYNLSPSEAMTIAKGGIPAGWWPAGLPGRLGAATGGHIRGPGTDTSDSIPAMLSDYEFVEPSNVVRHYGPAFFEALRNKAIPKELLPGFARGGMVDTRGVLRMATGGWVGVGGNHRQTADVTQLPSWQDLQRYNQQLLREKLKELADTFGTSDIKGFITHADSLPYVWAAAGPDAYDCSGLTGAVYGLIRGLPGAGKGARYFVTQSFADGAPAGFQPGVGGVYTVGVNPATHMAGEYGGLKFEAASTRSGIKVGPAAKDVRTFQKQFHLARGGLVTAEMAAALADPRMARRLGLNVGGDVSGPTINGDKVRLFDNGGWVDPGYTQMFNGTGRPEAVLTPVESQALVAMAKRGGGYDGPPVVNNFAFRDTTLTAGRLRAMQDADAIHQRVNRAH